MHGITHLNQVNATLFFDGSTGTGDGRSIVNWIDNDGLSSAGAELHFKGRFLFELETVLTVGGGYHIEDGSEGYYLNLNFSNFSGFGNERVIKNLSPEWNGSLGHLLE